MFFIDLIDRTVMACMLVIFVGISALYALFAGLIAYVSLGSTPFILAVIASAIVGIVWGIRTLPKPPIE